MARCSFQIKHMLYLSFPPKLLAFVMSKCPWNPWISFTTKLCQLRQELRSCIKLMWSDKKEHMNVESAIVRSALWIVQSMSSTDGRVMRWR